MTSSGVTSPSSRAPAPLGRWHRERGAALAMGESAEGLDGFRSSHDQALEAWSVATITGWHLVLYRDVVLMIALLRDRGANPALARVTYPSGDRSDAWYVIPGNDSLCFYSVKLGQGGCGSMANAAAGKLVAWTVPTPANGKPDASAGAEKVVGLVPDSVTGGKVTTKGGDAPASIGGNVVEASGSGITGLKLDTTSGGTLSTTAP